MSHFVFVESNTTGTGQLAVERLLAAGHQVTFMTRAPGKYPFLADGSAGLECAEVETNEVESVVRALRDRQTRRRVDALLTFSEFYVITVAEAAARVGLRYLNPKPARICREKPRLRRVLQDAGFRAPEFHVVASETEARSIAAGISYPCVVKPPADSSSHGVRQVANADELLAHFHTLSAWKENVRGQRLNGDVLIESLLDGPEFSVETMTLGPGDTRAIGVTAKHLSEPPHFVEMGHDFPAPAAPIMTSGLAATAVAALHAVGFDFGPAHTEIRWTSRGPAIVEINPRLAGGMIPELVAYATGIDLLGAWLNLVSGRPADLTPARHEVASIRFLTAPSAGTLARVDVPDAARRPPTIRQIEISRQVGANVRPAEDAYDRMGFVIASGPDRLAVSRDIDRTVKTIRFDVQAPRHAYV
jgi:cysteine synthase A